MSLDGALMLTEFVIFPHDLPPRSFDSRALGRYDEKHRFQEAAS